ncbi:hypothetical protein D3C78_1014280 [compost metagenome]
MVFGHKLIADIPFKPSIPLYRLITLSKLSALNGTHEALINKKVTMRPAKRGIVNPILAQVTLIPVATPCRTPHRMKLIVAPCHAPLIAKVISKFTSVRG